VAAELFANAVRHTRSGAPGGTVTIAVTADGVKFAIDTDTHSVPHLDNMKYGVGQAQSGWLTTDDVINT
jgi:DNA polymerase (family 10)